MINTLAVAGYRSLRDLVLSLDRLNLVTGPNGSGKSNLYRALRLLAETAQGRVIPSLAREGGLQSTLWAGPEQFSRAVLRGEQPVQGVAAQGPGQPAARLRQRRLQLRDRSRPAGASERRVRARSGDQARVRLERHDAAAVGGARRSARTARQSPGRGRASWTIVTQQLASFDSMMTHCADPRHTPEMLMLREQMRGVALLRSLPDRRDGAGAAARRSAPTRRS